MPNWHCMLKRSLTPVLGYVNNLLGDIGSYTGTGKATPVEHFQRNGSRFGSPKVYCLPPPWSSFSSITTESPWMFTYGGCWLAEGGGGVEQTVNLSVCIGLIRLEWLLGVGRWYVSDWSVWIGYLIRDVVFDWFVWIGYLISGVDTHLIDGIGVIDIRTHLRHYSTLQRH